MFFEAQVVTQEVNRGDIGLQGQVYLYRCNENTNSTDEKVKMNYWTAGYDDFMEKVNANDFSVYNYYTVNESGKIVIVGKETTGEGGQTKTDTTTTTTSTTTSEPDEDTDSNSELKTGNENYVLTVHEIEYKSLISQYATPMSFFITLGTTTRNPNFLEDIAKMVKEKAKIELTVLDNKTTETTTKVEKYTVHTKSREAYWGPDNSFEHAQITTTEEEQEVEDTTVTTVTSIVPTLKVTYVDTWVCTQTIKYTRLPDEVSSEDTKIEQESESEKSLNSSTSSLEEKALESSSVATESVSWTTRKPTEINITTTVKAFDTGTASDYRDNTYEFEDGTDGFIKYLDKVYTLPNAKEKRTAGAYLKTDAEMLFALLAQNSETQGMEQIMRYIMYKYTGKDYGVKELDFSIFDPDYYVSVGGASGTKEFIQYFEGTGPTDGDKYVVYVDSGGNRTVGHGINIEAQGNRFIARGMNPATIKKGDKIDKDIIDGIEDEIIAEMQSSIESVTSGLNLKPYQIAALTSRCYNCGNIKGFKEAYNKYWKDSDDEYGVAENESMYNHPLYTNYMSKPIKDNKGNTLPGLVTRRKAEWILFKTGYYKSSGSFYQEGGDIIQCAIKIHQYMEEKEYSYSLDPSKLARTFEASKKYERTCCATYVSWVLQEAGYISESEHTNSTKALHTLLKNKGFIVINSVSELKPGDVIIYDGHTEIEAGNGKVYNAGSTDAIQNPAPRNKGNSHPFICGMRAPN